MRKLLSVIAFLSSMVALIFILVSCVGNKSDKIRIGMSKDEVLDILGEPTDTDEGEWYWLSGSAESKYNEIKELIESEKESDWIKADKLSTELEKMSFEFTLCIFNSKNELIEYFYDKNHKYDDEDYYISESTKEVQNAIIDGFNEVKYIVNESIDSGYIELVGKNNNGYPCTIEFTDGSVFKNKINSIKLELAGANVKLLWSNRFGKYELSLPGTKAGSINKDGVIVEWNDDINNIPAGYALSNELIDHLGIKINVETNQNGIKYLGFSLNKYYKAISVLDTNIETAIIENGCVEIAQSSFENCESLKSVIIPDGVTSIGSFAFTGCTSLTSITIPDSVTSIGYAAFRDCTSLTSIAIPNSVTSIEGWAFHRCSSLTSITIPESVTSIDYSTFSGCAIKEATIPAIASTFIANLQLKKVAITSGNKIPESAFEYCSSLTNVTIPDSVTSIGSQAFYVCDSLTNITFIGTKAQWNNISKGINWNYKVPATFVTCTDGTVAL